MLNRMLDILSVQMFIVVNNPDKIIAKNIGTNEWFIYIVKLYKNGCVLKYNNIGQCLS
jgi:hypothetical protein